MSHDSVRRAFLRERVGPIVNLPVQFVRRGLVRPGPPARVARQLTTLLRWGTTLAGAFMSAAARDPGRTAVVDERGALTYAEVDTRTGRLAAALAALAAEGDAGDGATGSGGGDADTAGEGDGAAGTGGAVRPRIGVLCRNHRGMVESLVAAAKLGADVVLLNTGMGAARLLEVIERQRVTLLIADAEFDAVVTGVPPQVRTVIADGGAGTRATGGLPTLDGLVESTPDTEWAPPPEPGRTVILSSGTTGHPKGAHRPPRPGVRALAAILSRIPMRVHDTMLIEAPLFHTWGYAAMQFTLALRGTMVLRRRFDPEAALSAVARHRCTVMFAVPVMARRLVDLPDAVRARHDTSSLRVVAVSGSALAGGLGAAFMDAFGDILYNLYGSTEASWVSVAAPRDLRASPGTAGRPPTGTVVAILDAEGRPLPAGRTGRVFAANEAMFEGYTGGESTETRNGLLGLGDVGYLDDDGRLFVVGRDDDMVVSGGENIFPSEVEDVLSRLPEVREAAVIGVADDRFGQRLAAYVVRRPGADLDADAVRDRVRRRLARYAVPRDVHFLSELPRNATGKVVPRLLAEREGEDPG